MQVHVKIKQWGSSLGIVIPREVAKSLRLQKNQEVEIAISKPKQLASFYGALKGKKINWNEEDRVNVR